MGRGGRHRGLEVVEGRLVGKTTSTDSLIHVARGGEEFDDTDLLHSVEVRLKVSEGAIWG